MWAINAFGICWDSKTLHWLHRKCMVPFGFWPKLQILAAIEVSASKVAKQTYPPKERGGPLQTGFRSMLAPFEEKVMSVGKRCFWGCLGGSNGQWCGRVATLHFLWVYWHLKLLSWDGIENTGKYLVSFKSLVNGDGRWAVGQEAEQPSWVSVPQREFDLSFHSKAHHQKSSFLWSSVELSHPLAAPETWRGRFLLWVSCLLAMEALTLRLLYHKICSLDQHWEQGLVQMGCPFWLCHICLLTAMKLNLEKGTVFIGMWKSRKMLVLCILLNWREY